MTGQNILFEPLCIFQPIPQNLYYCMRLMLHANHSYAYAFHKQSCKNNSTVSASRLSCKHDTMPHALRILLFLFLPMHITGKALSSASSLPSGWSGPTSELLFQGCNDSHRLLDYHKASHWLTRARVCGYHLAKFFDGIVNVLNAQSAPKYAYS